MNVMKCKINVLVVF